MTEDKPYLSSFADTNIEQRNIKAFNLLNTLKSNLPPNILETSILLDIGTGSGINATYFSNFVSQVESCDVIDQRISFEGYNFTKINNILPYQANYFDIIISNHVIEHVSNPELHIKELYRVLKPGGFIYLATPNKYTIKEPHYKKYFISWFPSITKLYFKYILKKEFDVNLLSYYYLTRLFNKYNLEYNDLVPFILNNLYQYRLASKHTSNVIKLLPNFMKKAKYNLIVPSVIFLLKKSDF